MAKKSIYQIVTEQIITMLEQDLIPWRRPWVASAQRNAITKNYYNGFNVFVLEATKMANEYSKSLWCSVKQAKRKKGTLKETEYGNSAQVIFWPTKREENDEGKMVTRFLGIRYYNVYNVDQFDWEDPSFLDELEALPNERTQIDPDVFIFEHMPKKVDVRHRYDKAFYVPSADYVGMPKPKQFTSDGEYYSTLFHEITHSTGHKSRLGRFEGDVEETTFGSESYSFEELVAELGAAMLCAVWGISDDRVLENSASYIKSWKSRLTDNPTWMVQASSKATKAVQYTMGEKVNA